MASDSTMPEAEVHEEIGRRTIAISDLKEQLWDMRDRVEEVSHRSDSLVQGLTQKAHEIGFRKSCANNLEDKVALLEGQGEEQARSFRKAADHAAGELQRLQEEAARIDESAVSAAGRCRAQQQRAEILHAEGSSMRAKIEAANRMLEHQRDELNQDRAAEAARQARAEKAFQQQELEGRGAAEKQLAAATDAASAARSQVLRLEKALSMEKDTSAEFQKSAEQTRDRHDLGREECVALESELETLELQAEKKCIDDELAASRRDVQRLSQQVQNSKSEREFKRQSLQGALDETRRMLQDHLDATTLVTPVDQGLDIIVKALSEAKSRSVEEQATVALLQLQCNSLQTEVNQAETEASVIYSVSPSDQQRRHTELTLELREAEQSVRAASRSADDKAIEAVRAEAKVIDAEKAMQQKEALLRRKLVELWSWLRQVN